MQILRQTNLEALEKAKKLKPEGVLRLLEKKALVGRGGAGFPTAKKWSFAKSQKTNERYIICNADEGEPGTFKDKLIIMNNAETLIEGILIAAYTVGAKRCFIYLRGEYEYLRPKLEAQITDVIKKSGLNVSIGVVRGAGAYVCGEETAIIQSIMGFRGQPNYKPPYPPVEGLWGKPTIVNNVETLTCVPQAILYSDWNPYLRLFSISGNVNHPGVYELPLGVKMSTICDMTRPVNDIKAISFGCFGGIMPIEKNMVISQETICKEECQHGAYTLIMIDKTNNIVDICYSISKFYAYESCGKCTPCREGNIRLVNLLKKIKSKKASKEDLNTLLELAKHIQETSLCGLGQSAGNHIITAMKHFRKDFEEFVKKK